MKPFIYAFSLIILFCNASIAKSVVCSSPEILASLNDKIHGFALIRNTKLPPNKILDVPVSFTHFSDSVARDGWFPCTAIGSITIDQNIAELLTSEDLKYSNKAREITTDYLHKMKIEKRKDGKEYYISTTLNYVVFISSNDTLKDIELNANDPFSYYIYGVAWFMQNIDSVKSEIIKNSYVDAYQAFTREDDNINSLYNSFPEIIKKNLRSDMRKWIKEKNDLCGNVESLSKESVTIEKKTRVYRCQTEMTKKQIEILTE